MTYARITTSIEKSVQNYIHDALNSLNSEHPEWKNPENNQLTICIPNNFETVRRYIARKTGVKDKTAKVDSRGDSAEQKVFDALKSLDIGAIVVSNVDMKDFCHKADAIYEQYKMLVDKYNGAKEASDEIADKDSSDSISEDFESEFMLFHPKIGICCIEVKSACSAGTINKAQLQVYQVPLKLKLLFQAINGTESCEIPIWAAAMFPNDCLNDNIESKIKIMNPDAQILGKKKGEFKKRDNFRQFWTTLIDKSQNDELFTNEHFQRFIAVLCCYRGAVCLNGTLNAVRVAELVQQQLETPKMNPWKAAQLKSRREVHLNSIDSDQDIIFLTEEQQIVEMCSNRLQLIFGAPGTGKTVLLLLQILRAAQDAESTGIVIVQCKSSYRTKFGLFFEANAAKFAPSRRPIVFDSKIIFHIDDCDDIFTDEFAAGNEQLELLEQRIASPGRTICVVTNDFYPNNYGAYLEKFASLRNHYTTHILKTVMRGTSNIVNYWRDYVFGANFVIGHTISGPEVKSPKMCSTIRETLKEVFECVMKLIEEGVLPKYIAVITYFATEAEMVRDFIENVSGITIKVTGAHELVEGVGSVVVDQKDNVLSHEWPFVIVCSLHCIDLDDSFMLIACSRAIAKLTIIQRDYLSMQISIEKYISSHPKLSSSCFACFKQAVKKSMRSYLNESPEIFEIFAVPRLPKNVFILHFCLSILRLNIFPKSSRNSSQTFQSCHSFTDVLEFIMRDSKLMKIVASDYNAYFKNIYPHLKKIQIAPKEPNNIIERLLSNVPHAGNVLPEQKLETYQQFALKIAESLCDSFSEYHEFHGNVSLPRIFPYSRKRLDYWHDLLDIMQIIFISRKKYPTEYF